MNKAESLQAIMTAGRHIHEAVDTVDVIVAERLGVHRNDLRCLHLLESGPLTPGAVGVHTRLTSGSVTALLDRLEGAGFVERRRSLADRRSVEIAMPEARLAELRGVYDEIQQAIRGYFIGKDVAELNETARALEMFADALGVYARRAGCPPQGAEKP
jgi:DNA-binding MarR family transcriptional regulator